LLKKVLFTFVLALLISPLNQSSAASGQSTSTPGDIFTFWPLIDYRKDFAKKTSSLSILGPMLNFESTPNDEVFSFRPLIQNSRDNSATRSFSYYLYPLASTETTPDVDRFEFLQIFQNDRYRKSEPEEKERQSMIFPFFISGESKKYGSYTSVFPIYGDIYGRFWRDEYHYVLFPLYGRTVIKKTTNYHFLWPFFSMTSGENEAGFGIWPLYGQAAKEGAYSNMYFLWPIFTKEKRVISGDEISDRFSIFPLYASYDTPHVSSRTWLWPFFGYANDTRIGEKERNYFWPFWLTVSGTKRNIIRFLPFYSDEVAENYTKSWYLWPFYETDMMQSSSYRQRRERILYFLFSNKVESWAQDDKKRQRTTMWPLFLYNRNTDGESTLSIPAPVEPILDRDGIDKLWAPLWRFYLHKWNDRGDSQLSILWNLYWHDKSRESSGWELFPLFRRRSAMSFGEIQILKGLVNYTEAGNKRALSVLWIPFDFSWQGSPAPQNDKESAH
jgi:hypothetical protein